MHNANLFIYSILMNVRNGAAKYKFGNRVQCWCYPDARYYHLQQEFIQCFEINKATIVLWEWLDIPVDNLTHYLQYSRTHLHVNEFFTHHQTGVNSHWNSKRYNWNWHCHSVCYLKYDGERRILTRSLVGVKICLHVIG